MITINVWILAAMILAVPIGYLFGFVGSYLIYKIIDKLRAWRAS